VLIAYLTIGEAPTDAQISGLVIVVVGFQLTQKSWSKPLPLRPSAGEVKTSLTAP